MQRNYAHMRLIHVNMLHNYVDMQHNIMSNMRDNYAVLRLLELC